MMKNLNLFLMILMLGFISCSDSQGIDPETGCANIEIVNSIDNSTKSRSFSIQSAEIEGEKLKIEVNYNCGCGDSDFFLQSQAGFNKSIPVQTEVSLVLEGEDYCKVACITDLCFDLNELKTVFIETFSDDYSSLEINLTGFLEKLPLDI